MKSCIGPVLSTFAVRLLALILVLSASACRNYVKPVPPPEGKVLIKLNMLKPDATRMLATDITRCIAGISICKINDIERPQQISNPDSTVTEDLEQGASGAVVAWRRGYLISPGRQKLFVENDDEYCGDESRAGRWAAAVAGGLVVGSAVGVAVTTIPLAVLAAGQLPPVLIEFDAEAGKSYLLECNTDKTPWAWITPQDQR